MHAWYAREFLRRLEESGIPLPTAPLTSIEGVDQTVLLYEGQLKAIFVVTWGKGHKAKCRQPQSCVCHILDGHMKTRRIICSNKKARVIQAGKLGTFVLPCDRTPLFGSRFCAECRDAGAVRGHTNISSSRVLLDVPQQEQVAAHEDADPEHDPSQRVAPAERGVYLVEDILAERLCTVVREGEAHRKCARERKKSYLIRWVGFGEEDDQWTCHCNVGKAAIAGWEAKKKAEAEGRQQARAEAKHAGQLAAEAQKASPRCSHPRHSCALTIAQHHMLSPHARRRPSLRPATRTCPKRSGKRWTRRWSAPA